MWLLLLQLRGSMVEKTAAVHFSMESRVCTEHGVTPTLASLPGQLCINQLEEKILHVEWSIHLMGYRKGVEGVMLVFLHLGVMYVCVS